MKSKILPIIIVIILSFSGINLYATANNLNNNLNIKILEEKLSFSEASIILKDEQVTLKINEANSDISTPGKPILPVYIKTYKFPLGTIIKEVDCTYSSVKEKVIPGKIQLNPIAVPLTSMSQSNYVNYKKSYEKNNFYSNSGLYPDKWFEYSINVGLDYGEHTIFVNVYIYPVRYSSSNNTILCIQDADISLSYQEGISPITNQSKYDLLIITPQKFYLSVLPLEIHKDKVGVRTYIKTTESIYREYLFKGRDRPEKIKLFIKDALQKWGIKYVLLIGGRNNERFSFTVPVRYSNLNDRGYWNETYVSDLYYADIYKYNKTSGKYEFDDWDSNKDNIFAEWTFKWDPVNEYWYDIDKQDILDLYPDVYVGRLACNNVFEVNTVVNKIIKYENTAYNKTWFNRMVVAGGDTVPPPYGQPNIYEGEVENQLAASYMEPLGFQVYRLWVSNGNLKDYHDMINAITNGSGFFYCSGHGNPTVWSTHPPNDENTWIDGLYRMDMDSLKNGNMLPICVVGGCHNSQFDVGFPFFITGLLKLRLKFFTWVTDQNCLNKMAWVQNCWSWNLIIQKKGGSIATIGNSGLGWGAPDYDTTSGLDGWITTHFFQVYSEIHNLTNCTLGMVHSETLKDYITKFTPNKEYHELDRKTVEEWTLLGDPSLKIGGYS